IRNTELLREGPLVISFFRGNWCPYCRAELQALEQAAEDFRRLGAHLVLISPQNRAAAEQTRREHDLSFDVLCDPGNTYARQLGLVFTLPADLREVYRNFGIDLALTNEDDSWTLPVPARLVVDRLGIVRDADINADYTVRPDPSETIAALNSLRAS
ncbi:MAG TPA: peroxiredoxin-like family protein, partial [Steroidobacteraceae bacterium]|nr:peroxiredoxin-like family protein [Steroidobacteraceae bacterium]